MYMITEWNGELDKIGTDQSEGIAGWAGTISEKKMLGCRGRMISGWLGFCDHGSHGTVGCEFRRLP